MERKVAILMNFTCRTEEPLGSACQWQELSQAEPGVEGRACDEGLAQRVPETSQPVVGLGFGNRDQGLGPMQTVMKTTSSGGK